MTINAQDYLPGQKDPHDTTAQMLRVNHSGELAAVWIYRGQQAALQNQSQADKDLLSHMLEQEEGHLRIFNNLLAQRQVRPSLLTPLWKTAGFVLGAGTALIGKEMAMACTSAVETVIDEHYQQQISALPDKEADLKQTLEIIRQEECDHRDSAFEHGAQQAPAYEVANWVIQTGCKLAIKIARQL